MRQHELAGHVCGQLSLHFCSQRRGNLTFGHQGLPSTFTFARLEQLVEALRSSLQFLQVPEAPARAALTRARHPRSKRFVVYVCRLFIFRVESPVVKLPQMLGELVDPPKVTRNATRRGPCGRVPSTSTMPDRYVEAVLPPPAHGSPMDPRVDFDTRKTCPPADPATTPCYPFPTRRPVGVLQSILGKWKTLNTCWRIMDVDKDGVIGRKEFERGLEQSNLSFLSPEDREELWRSADADGNGVIDFDEFKAAVTGKTLQRREWVARPDVSPAASRKFSRTLSIPRHPNPWMSYNRPGTSFGTYDDGPSIYHVRNTRYDGAYSGQINFNTKSRIRRKKAAPFVAPESWPTQTIKPEDIKQSRKKRWSVNTGVRAQGTGFLSRTFGEACDDAPGKQEDWKKDWKFYKHNAVGKESNIWNDLYHTPVSGVWRTSPELVDIIERNQRVEMQRQKELESRHRDRLAQRRLTTLQRFYDQKMERVALEDCAGQLQQSRATTSPGSRGKRVFPGLRSPSQIRSRTVTDSEGKQVIKKTLKFYGQTGQNLWQNIERLGVKPLTYKLDARRDAIAYKAISKRVQADFDREQKEYEEKMKKVEAIRSRFRQRRRNRIRKSMEMGRSDGTQTAAAAIAAESRPRLPRFQVAQYLAKPKIKFEKPAELPVAHQDFNELYALQEFHHEIGSRNRESIRYSESNHRDVLNRSRLANVTRVRPKPKPWGVQGAARSPPVRRDRRRASRSAGSMEAINTLRDLDSFDRTIESIDIGNASNCKDYVNTPTN